MIAITLQRTKTTPYSDPTCNTHEVAVNEAAMCTQRYACDKYKCKITAK